MLRRLSSMLQQTARDPADDAERPLGDDAADARRTEAATAGCPSRPTRLAMRLRSANAMPSEAPPDGASGSADPASPPSTATVSEDEASGLPSGATPIEHVTERDDLPMNMLASDGDDEIVDDSDGDVNDNVGFEYDDYPDGQADGLEDASDASQTNEPIDAHAQLSWVQLAARNPNLSFAAVRLLSLDALMMRRQSTTGTHAGRPIHLDEDQTPQTAAEIDLTADSDDEPVVESIRPDPHAPSSAQDDDEDDDVQIVGTSVVPTTSRESHPTVAQPPLQPQLSRKRRRRPTGGASSSSGDDSGQQAANKRPLPDVHSAESTTISMENNEVLERFKQSLKCSICLDVLQDMSSTICGHIYCGKCIRLAIHMTHKCPLCQRPLRPKDMHPLFF
ncbi:hypothetical protein ATCC90586_008496 [Pythium insidiosum]|nr:hypothetical protein ATCC90586_008496 [Pythium insidiosum]